MNFAVRQAQEMVLLPRFELPEVMETIKATRPTSFPGVPTMYVAVNAYPGAEEYGVGSIRTCNSIVEGYGLSESSPVSRCNPITGLRKPGSVGLAYPDTDARIVDVEAGTQEIGRGQSWPGQGCVMGPSASEMGSMLGQCWQRWGYTGVIWLSRGMGRDRPQRQSP